MTISNFPATRKDLRPAQLTEQHELRMLPAWSIVQLTNTNEVCIVRSDTQSQGDPRIMVQFIDRTAASLKGATKVRLLKLHPDMVYDQLATVQVQLAPSDAEDTPITQLAQALGVLVQDMHQRPGAYRNAGMELNAVIGIAQSLVKLTSEGIADTMREAEIASEMLEVQHVA